MVGITLHDRDEQLSLVAMPTQPLTECVNNHNKTFSNLSNDWSIE